MAFSTLIVNPNTGLYGLWDSRTQSFSYKGSEEECDNIKNDLEKLEQKEDNKQVLQKIYDARLQQLMDGGGLTVKQAQEALKKHMPELHKQLMA